MPGAPGAYRSEELARMTLDALPVDALLHLCSHLGGNDLAQLEMACKKFAANKPTDQEEAVVDGSVSLMELAAKGSVEATDRTVSFKPKSSESWKRLLSRIDTFKASTPATDLYTGHHHFSKAFLDFCGGSFNCPQPTDFYLRSDPVDLASVSSQLRKRQVPTAVPDSDLMEHLERTSALGCAPAQYALACHYELGAGVPKDRTRARSLYQSSAQLGCTMAQEALARIDDLSVGYNIEDRPGVNFESDGMYHPLLYKKWMDGGAGQMAEMADEYDEEEMDGMRDPQDEFDQAMKSDNIAFIGNSVAFHMGGVRLSHSWHCTAAAGSHSLAYMACMLRN